MNRSAFDADQSEYPIPARHIMAALIASDRDALVEAYQARLRQAIAAPVIVVNGFFRRERDEFSFGCRAQSTPNLTSWFIVQLSQCVAGAF